MLAEKPVIEALHRLARRLSCGTVYSHPVGQSNALQGQAIYLDFPGGDLRLRLVLLFLRAGQSYGYHHALGWGPSWDYLVSPSPGYSDFHPPPPDDWDVELSRFESPIRQRLGSRQLSRRDPLPEFPQSEYGLLRAALEQRMRSWALPQFFLDTEIVPDSANWEKLLAWCPLLSPESVKEQAARGSFVLQPARLGLPYLAAESDVLDHYRRHPQAHGRLSLSAPGYSTDGRQAVLVLRHEVGFRPNVRGDWTGPEPCRPDASLPGPFEEVLVMERLEGAWKLAQRLDAWLPAPPLEREARVRQRLQKELGEWASVEKLELAEGRLSEAWIRRPEGLWRVVAGRELPFTQGTKIYLEPTLWIPEGPITGLGIRQAYEK